MGIVYVSETSDAGIELWAEGLSVVASKYYEYDNVIYRATDNHTATSSFDITKFDAISTSAEDPTKVNGGTTNLTDKQKNVKANATSGDVTLNIPTAVGKEDDTITITKTDSTVNTVTIVPDGIETISGKSSVVLYYQYQSAVLTSDGSNWFILSESSNNFARIVAGTTEPTDTTVFWLDIS